MNRERIGTRIGRLRTRDNISQDALAKALGVKRETVKFWESGDRHIKENDIIKLADYFNVPTDYLLGITEDYRRSPIAVDDLRLTNSAANNLRAFSNMEEMQILNQLLVSVDFWAIIHDVCKVRKLSNATTKDNSLLRENAALEARKEYRNRTGSSAVEVLHGEKYLKFLQYEIAEATTRLIQKVSESGKLSGRIDNGNK